MSARAPRPFAPTVDRFVRRVGVAVYVGAALLLTAGCGGGSEPDNRTRHNESHVTIHQNAAMKDAVIGWRVENGNRADKTFRAQTRLLELDVVGDGMKPTRCVLNIEAGQSTSPHDFLLDSRTESAWLIPCGELPKSTRVASPDESVVLLGHLNFTSDEDGNNGNWEFVIDEILQAPRIAEFEPKGSFSWDTPMPTASPVAETTTARSTEQAAGDTTTGTFHGYLCKAGCAGHRAGYHWAESRGITDPDSCPVDPHNSHSFTEGCWAQAGREGP